MSGGPYTDVSLWNLPPAALSQGLWWAGWFSLVLSILPELSLLCPLKVLLLRRSSFSPLPCAVSSHR